MWISIRFPEQLDVCREQLKAQELLLEEQNKAPALFAEALDFKFLAG